MRACSPRRLAAWTLSSLPPASASVPAALEAADYPNLIRTGETVSTIAVPAVLAVFNWPKTSDRYRRVSRFVEAYFTKFDQLQQPPFQPKWREINLAGKVPGWTRYRVAEELLAKMTADPQVKVHFDAFLDTRAGARGHGTLPNSEREALFKQFLEWQKSADW